MLYQLWLFLFSRLCPGSLGFTLVDDTRWTQQRVLLSLSKQQRHTFYFRSRTTWLASSVGGGGGGDIPPPDDNGDETWDQFFKEEESENMFKAREYLNENSLPISFQDDDDEQKSNDGGNPAAPESADKSSNEQEDSSTLIRSDDPQLLGKNAPSEVMLASNPYMAVVSRISPSDLIAKFTSTAHPRVQNAVRSTILSLIGGLPKMAFDTTTITTGERLASLMFQLQMTGYMFKNAEYRLSVQQSLGAVDDISFGNKFLLDGDASGEDEIPVDGKIKGKLRIRYGAKKEEATSKEDADNEASDEKSSENGSDDNDEEEGSTSSAKGLEMEVDAAAYMSELRSEVQQLRDELMITRKENEEALRKDLLAYIRTLPEQELRSLTNTISQDVLVAMKGLVNAVMSGIGEGQIGPETVTEQSGEAMAQLCMWQLVVGYNLRTLEVREEMKKSLSSGMGASTDSDNAGAASEDIGDGDFSPRVEDDIPDSFQ